MCACIYVLCVWGVWGARARACVWKRTALLLQDVDGGYQLLRATVFSAHRLLERLDLLLCALDVLLDWLVHALLQVRGQVLLCVWDE